MSAARSKGVRRHLRSAAGRGRAIALFGGAFDPIHTGHLVVAQAAARRFHLSAIHFIPSRWPPHKPAADLTPFPHRYAMVTLACAGNAKFLPSLAEAGLDGTRQVFYSIDTVDEFLNRMLRPGDRLYFLVGADAFCEIPSWKSYEELLDRCDFIVASRPGLALEALRSVIPPELLGCPPAKARSVIALRKTAVHLLASVSSRISSTEIRRRVSRGQSIHGLVPAAVEEYILKQALYR